MYFQIHLDVHFIILVHNLKHLRKKDQTIYIWINYHCTFSLQGTALESEQSPEVPQVTKIRQVAESAAPDNETTENWKITDNSSGENYGKRKEAANSRSYCQLD